MRLFLWTFTLCDVGAQEADSERSFREEIYGHIAVYSDLSRVC